MKKKKQSAALDVMDLVWQHGSRNSWQTLNSNLYTILQSLIQLDFVFDEGDYGKLVANFRGGYWLGVSHNGNHHGEGLYRAGTESYNNSFVLSYEKYTSRVPFIINNKRVFVGFTFSYQNKYCTITGWSLDNQKATAVGYKNGMKEGKRKLFKFDREMWLKERESMKPI